MAKKSTTDERLLRAMAKAEEVRRKLAEETEPEQVEDTSVEDFLGELDGAPPSESPDPVEPPAECLPEVVVRTPEVVIAPTSTPTSTVATNKSPLLTAHQLFVMWMRTNKGRDAADPRLPTDFTRLCTELEDRLRIAFEAGLNIGRNEETFP